MPIKRSRCDTALSAATAEQLRGSPHSHVTIRAPTVVNSSPLVELRHCTELWANVCSMLSGDALCCVASVSLFSSATRQTPSFILLAGLNNDAQLVPWNDRSNVLSSNYNSHCDICCSVCCRHEDNWDRVVSATKIAEALLWQAEYPAYLFNQIRSDKFRRWCYSGPARPPSPFNCPAFAYEPLLNDIPVFLNPPVYGIRPGFSYAPFWSVLVGSDYSDDD